MIDSEELNKDAKREFLINQDKFELILKAQKEIEDETELRPTFKKMINLIVNEESINKVKNEILEMMR